MIDIESRLADGVSSTCDSLSMQAGGRRAAALLEARRFYSDPLAGRIAPRSTRFSSDARCRVSHRRVVVDDGESRVLAGVLAQESVALASKQTDDCNRESGSRLSDLRYSLSACKRQSQC